MQSCPLLLILFSQITGRRLLSSPFSKLSYAADAQLFSLLQHLELAYFCFTTMDEQVHPL